MPGSEPADCAAAREHVRGGDFASAGRIIARIVQEELSLPVREVHVNQDPYSLNSLNGLIQSAGGAAYFFKFHQEEGEETTLRELYQAETLAAAGYPVDMPVLASRRIGRQILLYQRRQDKRLADVCLDIERYGDLGGRAGRIVDAQRALDRRVACIYADALHPITPSQSAAEPVHQLFHHRLVDVIDDGRLGGRAERYYVGKDFALGELHLPWSRVRRLRWRLNGVAYTDTLGELFERARRSLAPRAMGDTGGVTAHGDAHNANVWLDAADGQLSLFDPAFAGHHVPALLAEVKPTFHNIFAHPFWLYHPEEAAQRLSVRVAAAGDWLEVDTDWTLSPIRQAFLASKADHLWRPLLARMQRTGLLPEDWRARLRAALFCCPMLVTNLRSDPQAPARNPGISALGLAIAVMLGSEPEAGKSDAVSAFLDSIAP